MINWRVRIRNRNFWLALIPALALLVQYIGAVFGIALSLSELGEKLLAVTNQIFVLLAILGIVNDPTTATLADSPRAMTYTEPY